MKVGDVMTRGVISLAPDTPLRKAAQLMLRYGLSGFPVQDCGKLVGIVTEGDFLRRVETGTERRRRSWGEVAAGIGQLAAEYTRARARTVKDIMTCGVVTIGEDAPLEEAAALMERHHIKRIPVVRNGGVIGVVSRVNLLHAFLLGSLQEAPSPVDDEAIRGRISAELDCQAWVPHRSVSFTVENGVVELHGLIHDERQRIALRVAVENAPGVKGVHDHLRLFEPGTVE